MPTVPTSPQDTSTVPDSSITQNIPVDITLSKGSDNTASATGGDYTDPNATTVTISDSKTPLIVLFGPPSCGKTMTLIRLTRYLKGKGYTVTPDRSFRPNDDEEYKGLCDGFDTMISSDDAAQSTKNINFMLLRIFHQGKPICQILEGPGELYFDPQNPKKQYPAYLNTIISCANRKIWVLMLEPNSTSDKMDPTARRQYVDRIHQLKKQLTTRDKVVFLYNKVDQTECVISPGQVRTSLLRQEADFAYPNIFVPFKNNIPIVNLVSPDNFDFVPFQTGTYSQKVDGTYSFQEGHDIYPSKLWQVMLKRINGGW